jgi:hypothetical protein
MKTILLSLLLLACIFSQAQIQVQRATPAVFPIDAHAGQLYTLKIPVHPDTATALARAAVDSIGLIFKEKSSSKMWVRDTVPTGGHKWTLIGSGGGSSIDTTGLYLYQNKNLLDLPNKGTARTNLGLGTSAVKDVAASGDASSTQVVQGNDTRLTNSRPPSGSAGGSLAGTYPAPTIASGAVGNTHLFKMPTN